MIVQDCKTETPTAPTRPANAIGPLGAAQARAGGLYALQRPFSQREFARADLPPLARPGALGRQTKGRLSVWMTLTICSSTEPFFFFALLSRALALALDAHFAAT